MGFKNRGSLGPAPEISKIKPLAAGEKAVKKVEEEWRENRILTTEKERRENGQLITEEEVEEEEERQMDRENWLLAVKEEEDEEEVEQAIELLTTEELNKKCDDFIKKMKEGIKIEAQQRVML